MNTDSSSSSILPTLLEFLLHLCSLSFMIGMPNSRQDVPVDVPLDLSTSTAMSCIGTYGENCKSDNVSKYCVLLVAFQLL